MNTISSYWSRLVLSGLLCLAAIPVMAEEKIMYIPLGGYEYAALESRALQSPSLGAMIIGEDFFISGIYKHGSFSEKTPPGYPEHYHSIDTMLEAHKGRHQILSCFKTESDQPVAGGWATFQTTAIYNYQMISSENFNFRLGLGAALGDFGIDMEDGSNWPLIPVPFLGIEYSSRIIKADFSFVVGPNLSITIFPESKIRLSGEAEVNNYRDLQDLIFKAALHYRFFSGEDSADDFAGISAGIKNSSFSFTPGGSDKSYEFQYYSVFTELDLTLLKVSGGYAFNGQERLGEERPSKTGNGYFISLQAMYQF
ncbi:MAG: hypothetical protein RBT69_09770 [Spirochaetia bacterium]|nr:hypothetical protein [Spirochaetia bacterium]